jgi:hypothetical protein
MIGGMPRLFIGLLVILLTACARGTGGSADPSEPSPSYRPKVTPTLHIDRGPGKLMTFTGVLGSDPIEGGCPYLQTEKGDRYEVIYPPGWEIDRSTAELTNPQGEVVARAGDTITVRGEVAADMASYCQIGRIVRVDEVITSDR